MEMPTLILDIAGAAAVVGIIVAAIRLNRYRPAKEQSIATQGALQPEPKPPATAIPTIKFDGSRVTEEVKDGLRRDIQNIPDIDRDKIDEIYKTAVIAAMRGRDLGLLCGAIYDLHDGRLTRKRSGDISRLLIDRASVVINNNRMTEIGIDEAIWVYSGAPCRENMKSPSPKDLSRDAAHKAANGQRYQIAKGMFLNRKWTHPGREPGCRCSSRAVIPALE